MRFHRYIFLVLIASSLMVHANTSPDQEQKLHLGNGIAAIAEGEIITFEQLRKSLDPMVPKLRLQANSEAEFTQLIDKVSKDILQNIIDRIIIVKEAYNQGIQIPPSYIDGEYESIIKTDFNGNRSQFLAYLNSTGQTQDEFREELKRNIIVNVMQSQNRKKQSQISPEKIEDFYVKNKIRFYQPELIHLKQIILIPKSGETMETVLETANEIVRQLDAGKPIHSLANTYGDKTFNRANGDWGWIKREDLRSELSEVAFDLNIGEYTQPIQLGEAVFILYAENIQNEKIQPISQVRDLIETNLSREIAQKALDEWLEDLRSKAYVRYFL
ncbi:MAG: SurA N-terminal domain-containing protein [Verrucomicrobia bacterium]|nr:SurA N-terminal domain-containing protein [Verrucomicrobiota bacterium]